MPPLPKERWQQVEALFDEAQTLPPEQRAGLLALRAGNDPELRREVEALLEAAETRGDLLDRPAAAALLGIDPFLDGLPPGSRVGPWRIEALVGRGGMGEVYRAQRDDDGTFQQTVALKLIRREAVDQLERFHEERRVLARLDHPGIARLIDGGVAEDGRPYMAMEWVDGVPITDWCRQHTADRARRLELFVQVCESVAYAHRNLLVHRDLKPGNVLVTPEGRTKLLDFGVAKLLTTTDVEQTRTQAPMTLAYAAPEQLEQGAITPAVDVYALGLLLFELLTGTRPWQNPQLSLSMLMERRQRDAPAPSATAARLKDPPIPAKPLEGDLDAITAFSLRREPERRYRSAAELADDVKRHLDGKPVQARPESLGYSLNRFVRRNRVATGFAIVALVALIAGLAASLWQAREAQREAARATATKDFLVGVFRASDPRIAQDKPRGQITAKELLDLNAPKISEEFKNDPETQIELLRVVMGIYDMFDESELRDQYLPKFMEVAKTVHGERHPVYVDALIDSAVFASYRNDLLKAQQSLAKADELIHQGGLDNSVQRAYWWLARGHLLVADYAGRKAAFEEAARRYSVVAPNDPAYADVLQLLESFVKTRDPIQAERYLLRALEVIEHSPTPSAAKKAGLYAELGRVRELKGDYDDAAAAFRQSADFSRQSIGEGHPQSVMYQGHYAAMLHRRGQREPAHKVFERQLQLIPSAESFRETSYFLDYLRKFYGDCLVSEGRALEAIPTLEQVHEAFLEKKSDEPNLRAIRRSLGIAYAEVGRDKRARSMLMATLDESIAQLPKDDPALLQARQTWGDFLLSQGDIPRTEAQLREILSRAAPHSKVGVLAQRNIAQLAILRNDPAVALAESRRAVEGFDRLSGDYDVRTGPLVWLVHADALRLSGDARSARDFAERALDASRRYDHPTAPSIADAQIALANAYLDLGNLEQARALARDAATIHAHHKELAERYHKPLRELQARLKRS